MRGATIAVRGLQGLTDVFIAVIIMHITIRSCTVNILKVGTPQTIAIIVLKLVKFDVTLH